MKRIVPLLIAVVISFASFSQSKTLENVVDVKLQSSVTITNNKQIVGYAFFYKLDKIKKGAMYRLEILDENLKSIGSNEFEGSKNLLLKRAIYESNQILLSFFDRDKRDGYDRFVKVFDLKGKETATIPYEPEKVKKGMFGAQLAENMEAFYDGVDNVPDKGFICGYQSKAKTGGMDLQMIDNKGKLKWEASFTGDGGRTDMYILASTSNIILIFEIDRKGGVWAKDADVFLLGLNADNGKQIFKKPMDIKGTTYEPMMIKTTDDNKLKIISTLYDTDSKFYTARPHGFGIADLDDITGDMKIVKDFNYEKDLGDVLNMINESKSEEGYVKAHNLVLMQDGSIVVVGEFFRRTVSAMGMAAKILSKGNGSASQATIGDMFLLRIDNNFKPKGLEKIEKEKTRELLPADGIPIGYIARYLTYTHSFGYMYTDEGLDGKNKTIIARGSFDGDKYGMSAITINPTKGFTQKKFNVEREKNVSYFITRGKPGTVLIMKYNSKQKTVDLNLEKIN